MTQKERIPKDLHALSPAGVLLSVRSLAIEFGLSDDQVEWFLQWLRVPVADLPDGKYVWPFAFEMALLSHLLPYGSGISKRAWSRPTAREVLTGIQNQHDDTFPGKNGLRALRRGSDPEAFAQLLCIAGTYYDHFTIKEMKTRMRMFGNTLCNRAITDANPEWDSLRKTRAVSTLPPEIGPPPPDKGLGALKGETPSA